MAKKRLSAVLGVDIGSDSIKVAEIKNQGRQPTVTAIGTVPTPEGTVDHTGVYDGDAVGSALKSLLASIGSKVPQAVVSIAGQNSVLVRTVAVPKMNDADLKDYMQWEINRSVPFSDPTIYSDYKAFERPDPNDQEMDVVLAIAPKTAVDEVVKLVRKAGKQPNSIDVEPLGLGRSLKVSYDDELGPKTVCLIDIGHKTTAINIYREGQLLLPRQVPVGGESFTRELAAGLRLSNQEAEDLKRNQALIPIGAAEAMNFNPFGGFGDFGGGGETFQPYNPFSEDPIAPAPPTEADAGSELAPAGPPPVSEDPEEVRIYQAMAPAVDEFVAEVRRSLDFYRSKGGDVDIILLCGGGAHLKGLPDFLSKVVNIPVEMYDPLRGIAMSAKKLDNTMLDEHRQEFAVAVGNGLSIFFD